ncbi:MAG TPA: YqgE/AlgH family protein [Bryobacteraceae bacterium]|nr:YqgE/AlgH family protein [Bryobacteraceae bacterium]
MSWRWSAALLILAVAAAKGDDALAPGKLLVASRDITDPHFSESVILLIDYAPDKGATGLIVNRRSKVPISRLLGDLNEAKNRSDGVYLGGPNDLSNVVALMKAASKPGDDDPVFGDTYLVNRKNTLQKVLAAGTGADCLHIFVGYVVWPAGRLEYELDLGAWRVMPGDTEMVFHADPDSVWGKMIRKTEEQFALDRRYPVRNISVGSTLLARRAGT